MEGKWLMITLIAVASVATTSATDHIVGGDKGWTIPASTSFYPQWASPQTFVVGDTLVFNFTTGGHNVVEVPKSSYDSCSLSNQIGTTFQTGPATVPITTMGSHYYICGIPTHCSIGQKLSISVGPAGKSSSGPSMSPAPGSPMTPRVTTPAPGSPMTPRVTTPAPGSPMTPMTPSGTTMGPTGGSVPKNSAPSSLISSGYLAILAALSAAFLL